LWLFVKENHTLLIKARSHLIKVFLGTLLYIKSSIPLKKFYLSLGDLKNLLLNNGSIGSHERIRHPWSDAGQENQMPVGLTNKTEMYFLLLTQKLQFWSEAQVLIFIHSFIHSLIRYVYWKCTWLWNQGLREERQRPWSQEYYI